jgi:hypothetical protein
MIKKAVIDMKDKDTSKIRTNWLRQERNSKGHFMPYKKDKPMFDLIAQETKCSCSECGRKSEDGWALYCVDCLESFRASDIEHAFYAGLKANNSFYPPSKLWGFYKRDRGLV